MDKFHDIQVGDKVYESEVLIACGWGLRVNAGVGFFLPRKVTKVTNKQFEIEGQRCKFRKSDGLIVSSSKHGKAYQLGDSVGFYSDRVVTDQSDEYNQAVLAIKQYHELQKLVDSFQHDTRVVIKNVELINNAIEVMRKLKDENN